MDLEYNQVAKIKVFGIGGAGCNAVNRMVEEGVQGVEFYVANTDMQDLNKSPVENKIILGRETTRGLGAGANPEMGRKAALENEEEIRRTSENTDEASGESYDLAATKQAVVTNVVMRGGTAAVKTDMQVQPGDILVYGRYDIVDDNKEIVRTQYLRADADVYGKVVYGYEDILPLAHTEKEYYGKEKKKISFRAGDKIWEIANTKKKKNQEVVTQEKQLYLYDNFYLPFYLIQESRKTYTEKKYQYSREQAEQIAEEKLSYFIEKLEKNTIQIVENNVTIETNDNVCRSSGAITVIENIGQLQPAAPEDLTGETTENYE